MRMAKLRSFLKICNAEKLLLQSLERRTEQVKNQKYALNNKLAKEYGGPKGREPTRFGDWEKNGRVSDF